MKLKAQISFVALFNEVASTKLKSIVAAIEATEIQTSKSLFVFFFFFQDKFSLSDSYQAGLELTTSAYQVLGLKTCNIATQQLTSRSLPRVLFFLQDG